MSKGISRRTFIKGTVAMGAAVAIGGCGKWNGNNIPKDVQKGNVTYDVLIIGSGLAGLRAALEASKEKDRKVAVMTKTAPTRCASTMAQGGMNGVTKETDPADTPESHVFDTIKGGDYLCDQDSVEYFAETAGSIIHEMDYLGTPYNRQENGSKIQRKMGGSSHPRTSYYGASTGHALVHTLFEQCLARNVEFITDCQMLEIVANDRKLSGAVAIDMRSGNTIAIPAKSILLATGGYGRAYWIRTTNPYISTGDGIAAAINVGIPFMDPEMVQFHPTGLASNGVLLSEACRGEGAFLVNKQGERFMSRYAPQQMELATRDIIARAIETEIEQGRGDGEGLQAHVFMDFRHLPKEVVLERLDQVYDLSLRFEGVDVFKEPVPIRTSCHYSMGGIEVTNFKTMMTRVPGIFAAGECSCVSVHGANRLGGNSTIEATMFGRQAGIGITEYLANNSSYTGNTADIEAAKAKWQAKFAAVTQRTSGPKIEEIRDKMAETLWYKAGVYREEKQLQEAAAEIDKLTAAYQNCYVGDDSHTYNTAFLHYVELGNLLDIAKGIIMGAIARKESRGGHSRRDYPQRDDVNFLKHTLVFKDGDAYRTEYKDVVITKYQPKERKY